MARIAILNCSNTTQDLGCSACMCLENLRTKSMQFERYKNKGGADLVGIINCAGCPTAVAPEKVLNRVRSLSVLGVDAIHISSCIMAICPFKNKYADMLRKEFPGIEIVEGTHGSPDDETAQQFRQLARSLLTAPKSYLPEIAMKTIKK
jgi:predicted metal-binding protein